MNIKKFSETVGEWGWIVRTMATGIEMLKMYGSDKRRQTASVVIRQVTGGYMMEFPDKAFVSRLSIFAPAVEDERRYVRSSYVVGSMFEALKHTEIVDKILNWEQLVVINRHNKNLNSRLAHERLTQFKKIKKAAA